MPKTFGPGDVRPGISPLEVAFSQLGVREIGGANRGPRVDDYLRFVGLDPAKGPFAWCCAWIVWVHAQAGITIPRTASVRRLWELARAANRVEEPLPGDVFIHLRPDSKGHCGLVAAVREDGSIETVEGNSSDTSGTREGDGVYRKVRPRSYCRGFLRFTAPQVA